MYKNIFKGTNIYLSAFFEEDAQKLSEFSEDGDYLRSLDTDYALPHSSEFYKSSILSQEQDKNLVDFAIRLNNRDLIGFIALHSIEWNNHLAMLAIGIGDKNYRSKGYGSEALQLILNYGFNELNLNRIGLDVISNNESAIKCYKKNGFVVEGVAREAILRDGKRYDKIYMGILEKEWRSIL